MKLRTQYLLNALPCLVNILGMFYVAFGAAFGGPRIVMLWPALALLAGGIFIFAFISSSRATEIGVSPVSAFIVVLLSPFLGPTILLAVAYLAFHQEVPNTPQIVSPSYWNWLQPLLLFVIPWIIILAISPFSA